jgi:DNA polymerase-3 subunit gamma/tau
LTKILEQEKIKYDLEGIHFISQKANGSLRDALSLLDQAIAYSIDELDVETVRDVLGIIKENTFLDIIKNIEQKNNQNVIDQLNNIIDEGYAISDFICGFNEYLRNCMLLKTGDSGKIKISDDSTSWAKACRFTILDFLRMLDLSLQFESNLKFIQQPQISLEALFIKLSMMDSSVDIAQILGGEEQGNIPIKKPKSKQKTISNETSDTITDQSNPQKIAEPLKVKPVSEKPDKQPDISVTSESEPISKENITFDDIISSWSEIISTMEKKNSKVAHFLEEAKLSSFDGKQVLIELINGHRFHIKTLEKDVKIIESIMTDILKQQINIKFHIQESSGEKPEKNKSENAEHPLFMKVLETFEGEIIR